MEYIRAFLVGGIICILVQILMDHTTLQPGRIMVLLVIAGVILGALGIYKRTVVYGLPETHSSVTLLIQSVMVLH